MKVLSVSLIPGPSPEGRREITESLAATFTLTFMMPIATPRTMKIPQVFVGAGFKPALRRKIDLIRPGNVLGGFETRPYQTVLRSNVCDVFHAKNLS